ncbi:hypothetical protein NL533_35850, partial [Klebsiella pneumoniae]|nr:hypothetical protein [Klebsiella pneumoniae]
IVIAIGTRLRDVDARRRSVKIAEVVRIDIDDRWIGRNYPACLTFAGDPLEALRGIQHVLKGKVFKWNLEDLAMSRKKE